MNNADAYMISLDDVVYNEGIKRISLSIPIKKFDAIRGDSLIDYVNNIKNVSIRAQSALTFDYRDSNYDLTTLNSIGCYLSHVELWNKIVTEKLNGMYIFESDAYCLSSIENVENVDMNNFLKMNGDILLFGSRLVGNSYIIPINYGRKNGLSRIKQHFYGLHAYYITYKGALKALKYAIPIEAQVDAYLSYLAKLDLINIYGIYPVVCDQLGHMSTLQTKPVKHVMDSLLIMFGIIIFCIIVILIITYTRR